MIMTILVTGATGNVGKHVVSELVAAGRQVRALSRTPALANLPGAEVVGGELPDLPESVLAGVGPVFLVWPFTDAAAAQAVVEQLARHASRIVFLSARGVTDDSPLFHARIEVHIRESGVPWTFVRPGGFATNTLGWADDVRAGVVRWVYGAAGRSLIHERDIADVAVRALTEPGREGHAYELTGPETLTQVEQVRIIADAVGRDVRWEELPVEQVRELLLARGWSPDFVDIGLPSWASLVDDPETVTKTVEEITGRPARTFAEWAADHSADFR